MGKRSNKEGYFQKLPSGNYRGQIMDGYRPDGKKNIVSFTARTKGEVQEKIRRYLSDKESGVLAQKEHTPFNIWADTWYMDYKDQVQPSTYANYQYTLKTLKDHFGKRSVQDIQLVHINAFLSALKSRGFSQSKLNKCKAMLIQIFAYAEDNNMIVKNPALRARITRTGGSETSDKKDAFTLNETASMMHDLPDNLLGNSIRLLLVSGLRVQELLALTQQDIAEDGSWINVNKAIKMVDGIPTLGPPKSKKSQRKIPIPADYRCFAAKVRMQGGKAFIWSSSRPDLLYNVKRFRMQYYKAIRQIPGVRKLSPHCCRHTYITRLEAEGVPLQLIARLAGHSNIDTTVGYTHTELETLSKAVDALNHMGDL